jgi:hypothetical protein
MELKDYGTLHFTKNGIDKQQHFTVSWPARSAGNADSLVIKCIGDQFCMTKFKELPDGFELEILGAWEANEFLTALAQAASAYGVGEFYLKSEKE